MEFSNDLYNYFGCHLNSKGYTFRVYAPNAIKVCLIGEFNNWNEEYSNMNNLGNGVFEILIKNACELDMYKYVIYTKNNQKLYKADPFAFYNDLGEDKNSRVYTLDEYIWHNRSYIKKRHNLFDKPLNIYEVHLGSWKRDENGNYLNYRTIADELIPYVKQMGYTHIELMPITEYPYDGSWGYQVTGYFSVTSRFGEPYDFMYLIDKAHHNGLGVIIDWVPAHFPKDFHGLYEFDGSYLYEDSEPLRREHEEWGTRVFDFGKPYVKSFLISSALFFFEMYHIDGIRVDAVASMLYLDYGRKIFKPNKYGNNFNLEAIEFLKELNINVFKNYPYALMIAEESTAYAQVTSPVYAGGLGFSYKWNMGWMNDTLEYMQSNKRHDLHNKMSFSMWYAYNENFILPLSHDEVVHGKKSLLDKMPADYDAKFANLRAYYGYMMTHPGKKLTFMGSEIAQFIEWNYKQGLDWLLLKYPRHNEMQKYFRDLNKFYLKNKPLWELDYDRKGFEWIIENDGNDGYIYRRFDRDNNSLIIICNFSDFYKDKYILNINNNDNYEELFNSDSIKYGGKGRVNRIINNKKKALTLKIAPLSFMVIAKVKKED